jgi:predicted RNA-binding Zn-ribbon protein involved in translation (DUF1610 family)
MHTYETEIRCPECGETEIIVYTRKSLMEGVLNLLISFEKLKNLIMNDSMESKIQEKVESMECQNCGNMESKLDETVLSRSPNSNNS